VSSATRRQGQPPGKVSEQLLAGIRYDVSAYSNHRVQQQQQQQHDGCRQPNVDFHCCRKHADHVDGADWQNRRRNQAHGLQVGAAGVSRPGSRKPTDETDLLSCQRRSCLVQCWRGSAEASSPTASSRPFYCV